MICLFSIASIWSRNNNYVCVVDGATADLDLAPFQRLFQDNIRNLKHLRDKVHTCCTSVVLLLLLTPLLVLFLSKLSFYSSFFISIYHGPSFNYPLPFIHAPLRYLNCSFPRTSSLSLFLQFLSHYLLLYSCFYTFPPMSSNIVLFSSIASPTFIFTSLFILLPTPLRQMIVFARQRQRPKKWSESIKRK